MSIRGVIKIVSWAIDKYENTKKWITNKVKAFKTRKVRRLVDNRDIGGIHRIVQRIKRKRRDRRDSS